MKHLALFLIFLSAVTGCPKIDVDSAEKVFLPAGKYFHPRFDPAGKKLLLSAENYKGLLLYEPSAGKLVTISEEDGAGYSPVFSSDGKKVYYTENEFIRNLRHIKLNSYTVAEDKRELLQGPVRTLAGPVVSGNGVFYAEADQLKSATIPSDTVNNAVMVSIEDQKLVLYTSGERKVLQPYPGESYIWPSLSPDGKQILAYAMGKGSFICDLEGNLQAGYGKLDAPVWAGNRVIVGMDTADDGHNITSSVIFMVDTETGARTQISPGGIIAMYPSVSVASEQVAFHTPAGEIYVIRYHVKK
jgi:Tol biopolymer transport system component